MTRLYECGMVGNYIWKDDKSGSEYFFNLLEKVCANDVLEAIEKTKKYIWKTIDGVESEDEIIILNCRVDEVKFIMNIDIE